MRAGDLETLVAMLHDPDRDEAILVARELFKRGYAAHRPLIERMADATKLSCRRRDLPGISATKLLASIKKAEAAKKPAASAKATNGKAALRGVALVEKVIARIRAEHLIAAPQPMPPRELATLTFPSGALPSPGLRAFRAFDARESGSSPIRSRRASRR